MREIQFTSIDDVKLLLESEGGCAVSAMPEDDYFMMPCIGSSFLMDMRRCPRYLWHGSPWCPEEERRPLKKTESMEFGSAMHLYLLEPDRFFDVYRVEPDKEKYLTTIDQMLAYAKERGHEVPRGRKAEVIEHVSSVFPDAPIWDVAKSRFDEDCEAGSVRPITKPKLELVVNMATALKREVFSIGSARIPLGKLFEKGEAEKTFFWRHEGTGLDIMCRADWYFKNIIFEYRTCVDASLQGFSRAARQRNYHIRAGMYWKIVKEVTGHDPRYYYIAQEKEEPHLVSMYEQSAEDLQMGWALAEECLERIAGCLEGGSGERESWPSYNENKVVALDIPDFAFRPLDGGEW